MLLTKTELQEAKRLCGEATPGRWTFEGGTINDDRGIHMIGYCGSECDESVANMEFIAASRSLLPKLIEAVGTLADSLDTIADMYDPGAPGESAVEMRDQAIHTLNKLEN